jgi:NAD(P)-dependent dehydrogenase (short-subunit alcohol dehydrogenase family)
MTMDIGQASAHLSASAGRGIAKMDGTGKLNNKIALITGGTTGIGAATATRFQAEGARVIVTGSDPTTLQVARENMPGIEVIASEASDVAATKRLVETVKATHGRIDVLFVNAGISRFMPISMVDEAFFDTLFGINVRGAHFVMKHAIEIMPDGGSIILTASLSLSLERAALPDRPFMAPRKQQSARSDDPSPGSLRPVASASTQSVPARSRHLFTSRPECSSEKWRA